MPEVLARPDNRIILICCDKSQVRLSKFVDEVIVISNHHSCSDFAEDLIRNRELLERIDGWVVFGRDDDMYRIAHSDLPDEIKMKLLPIRNLQAMHLPGSKIEFVNFCMQAKISIPRSEIVDSQISLDHSLESFPLPVILKSDRGAGGSAVRVISERGELEGSPIPQSWFPLVVQEFIVGDLRGVDAFYREGRLLAWMYCDEFIFTSEFGPSVQRRYVKPPTEDFVQDLIKFGAETGAHGFANCSFLYVPNKNRHFFFEADMRTNAWHQYGSVFVLDWAKLMSAPLDEVKDRIVKPLIQPTEGRTLINWQRYMEFAIQNRQWRLVLRLLRMDRSEKYPVVYQDQAINRAQTLGLFRLLPIAFAKLLFKFLPQKLQKKLKNRGTTARFASRVARG